METSMIIAVVVLALLFAPILRIAVNAANMRRPAARKRCPQCAETVKIAAKICHFCRYEFPATLNLPCLKGFPLLNAMAELQTTEVVRTILKELMAAGFSPIKESFTVSCYADLQVKGETGADLFHPLGKSRYSYNTDSIQWSTGIW